MQVAPEVQAEVRKRVVAELWRRGNLSYLLDDTQKEIRVKLEASDSRKFFFLCSRRLGKSFTLTVMAFEMALRKPNSRIFYMAPYAKDAKDIAGDIAATILADCPEDLKPDYAVQDREYKFGNGSVIRIKGVNGEHAQFLRGGAADMIILDECGIMDDLKHVVSDVAMPMVLTTGGRIFLATTPPRTPGHDSALLYEECEGRGAAVTYDISANKRVSDAIKAEFLVEAGERADEALDILHGLKPARTTTARREYFCEFVTDASLAVLPEFDLEARLEIVKTAERPDFFDCYTAMDPGMKDRTGILYAYWDFARGKLVIEDESLLTAPSTLKIAQEILDKEYYWWKGQAPHLRISDVDLRLASDLYEMHRISVTQADKQDSLGAINRVRNMIQTRTLEINPRCVNLVRQMKNAIWNNRATDFSRDAESGPDGHYDLVAALKYLCRHVNYRKNPYPPGYLRKDEPNRFRSPRNSAIADRQKMGLLSDTPVARRLAGLKSRRT